MHFKTLVIVSSLMVVSSEAFTAPAVIQKAVACGPAALYACAERRDLLLTIAGVLSASFSAKALAADDTVETKSLLVKALKSSLPKEKMESSRETKIINPLDTISWDRPKRRGLNPEQMADAINDGLREREWFVTGKGLPELYSDNFSFSDPQVSLTGYEQYCRQVRLLFDQTTARCEIVCCSVTAPDTITVLWRNSGRVNIGPVGIILKPYIVATKLRMDPNDGNLIVSQVDEFASDGFGLLLYQVPFLRPLAGKPVPDIDVLRQQCDFYTCKLKS